VDGGVKFGCGKNLCGRRGSVGRTHASFLWCTAEGPTPTPYLSGKILEPLDLGLDLKCKILKTNGLFREYSAKSSNN
jgi:hypothetical protein